MISLWGIWADCRKAIDQGEYSILRLVQDLGPFLGSDENLVSVARGELHFNSGTIQD